MEKMENRLDFIIDEVEEDMEKEARWYMLLLHDGNEFAVKEYAGNIHEGMFLHSEDGSLFRKEQGDTRVFFCNEDGTHIKDVGVIDIKTLWGDFITTPAIDGRIDKVWNRFPKGTARKEIFEWLKKEFGISIENFLHGMLEGNEECIVAPYYSVNLANGSKVSMQELPLGFTPDGAPVFKSPESCGEMRLRDFNGKYYKKPYGSLEIKDSHGGYAGEIDVENLWELLGDVPIDEDENIELKWNRFSAGTFREEIWHWFEHEFGVAVADLM